MKIYTRRGDGGETDLFGGRRVPKDDLRVAAYGTADELNSLLGVCAAQTGQDELRSLLQELQGQLFELGSLLAAPDADAGRNDVLPGLGEAEVAAMEAHIDAFESELPALRSFILPGGVEAAASLHLARSVCRRLERGLVGLHRSEPVEEALLRYVNRLSDLLFVLARVENLRAGAAELPWEPRKGKV